MLLTPRLCGHHHRDGALRTSPLACSARGGVWRLSPQVHVHRFSSGRSRLALQPLPTHRAAASRPLECDAVDANAALDNITRMPGKCGASVPWA